MKRLIPLLLSLLVGCATVEGPKMVQPPALEQAPVIEPDFSLNTGTIAIQEPDIPLDTPISVETKDMPAVDFLKWVADKASVSLVLELEEPGVLAEATVTISAKKMRAGELLKATAKSLDLWIECLSEACTAVRVKDRISLSWVLPFAPFDAEASYTRQNVTIKTSGDLIQRLEADLKACVGDKGRVVFNPVTGTVYVEGRPSGVQRAGAILEQVQRELSQYVYLKLYVMKLNTKKLHERGWKLEDIFSLGKEGKNQLKIGWNPALPSEPVFALQINYDRFSSIIQMLESENLAEVVSAPSLLVRNSTPASIEISKEVGWFEPGEASRTLSEGTVIYERGKPTFQKISVGFKLGIRPRILDSETVQALIHMDDTDVIGYATYLWQESTELPAIELRYPLLFKRELTTELVAKVGTWTLLGGFREHKNEGSLSTAPGISKVPLLKKLLSGTRIEKTENDLFIAVTVRILR